MKSLTCKHEKVIQKRDGKVKWWECAACGRMQPTPPDKRKRKREGDS